MAIVTNSIGTATRDYSTIALWEAALPASAVTAGNSYVGQCYNDTEFNASTTAISISGTTTDATHTITLTTGPGQGFRDNASAATNALRYNQSNGVGITGSIGYGQLVSVADNYVTLSNLQFRNTASNGQGVVVSSAGTTNFIVDSCILQGGGRSGDTNNFVLNLGDASSVAQNCLVIQDTDTSPGMRISFNSNAINCTVVRPTNRTAGGNGIQTAYGSDTIQNCVIAGFTTSVSGGATKTGSGNAIDTASYPASLTGQVSLTIATEFVQPSNASSVMDWRLNSTSIKCNQTGTNAGAPATDIIGTTRPQGTNVCVGAWELKVTGGTRGLFLNSTLSLGAGGSFFADRLAT